jgi:hypothetical protein
VDQVDFGYDETVNLPSLTLAGTAHRSRYRDVQRHDIDKDDKNVYIRDPLVLYESERLLQLQYVQSCY